MTLSDYCIFSASMLFVLYLCVMNINVKSSNRIKKKPLVKPMKLFTGSNGISINKLKQIYKLK
ncbi:hypothetical protein CLV98_12337 [Dyadobacter jejuensis]|uniref:Uncharacterized protein n=1 Tax=Dyadobacter jejuensis TaxID=1082580 RepID=A0A316A752_9BACT|nr:hypothetical protein CLV98_12337 [Dyadobacter jejuensis]